MKKTFLLFSLLSLIIYPQTKRAITVDDLWEMKRIENYDVSPDGKTLAFTLTSYTFEANKGNSDIYLIDADGKSLRVLKNSDNNEDEPIFSPDGKTIAFTRGGQIWQCNFDGSNEKQLTNIYTKTSGFKWSPDGKKILFVSSVYPECTTQDCNKQKDKAKEESKVIFELLN